MSNEFAIRGSRIVIGTRGSRLALTQARWVEAEIHRFSPDTEIVLRTIQTQGDATQKANIPLSSFGEKGIFAKELEASLLAREIDLAVHSLKDMTHTLPSGLALAAIPQREDCRDALVGSSLEALSQGARVGTGSVRRRALLLSRRPDLNLLEIRGNIDTRLRKQQNGDYDAICLATAGLNRLGLQKQIAQILEPEWFTPDPGQGALGLEIREDDQNMRRILQDLDHPEASVCVRAERAFLQEIGGSCKTPVGAWARILTEAPSKIRVTGMIAAPDGSEVFRETVSGEIAEAEALGKAVAKRLIGSAAGRHLDQSTVIDRGGES